MGTKEAATRAAAIRHAHARLMATYDDVLSDASLLTHRVVPGASADTRSRILKALGGLFRVLTRTPRPGPRRALRAFRGTVRFLCELHIRQKLLHLNRIYRQVEESVASSDRDWFRDTQEHLERMAQSLAGWAPLRRGAASFFSFGAGAAVVVFGADDARDALVAAFNWVTSLSSGPLFVLLASLFIAVQYASLWVMEAFEAKRDLFFVDWRAASGDPKPQTSATWDRPTPASRNVYELEDDLFHELRREKPREAPVDAVLLVAGMLLFALAAVSAVGAATGLHWTAEIFLLLFAAGFVVTAAVVVWATGKRVGR